MRRDLTRQGEEARGRPPSAIETSPRESRAVKRQMKNEKDKKGGPEEGTGRHATGERHVSGERESASENARAQGHGKETP